MKAFVIALFAALLLSGCQKSRTSDPQYADSTADTLVADSLPADTTMITPPKKADGLFDDFIYSFMRNPKFQTQRIKFPLAVTHNGRVTRMARKDWHYDRLFLKQDIYTVIFDSEASSKAEKDTSLDSVMVEWVYLSQHRVKQYAFHKLEGEWFLTGINEHPVSANVNSDFYEFYNRFSSHTDYQMKHVKNPLKFKTYDEDNFQPIEGILDVQQWPDFRPELPKGVITNINYGQHYADSRRRVLMICTPSGGMGCSLTFEKGSKGWMLTKYVN